jgi:hypothetical protein
MPGVETPGCGRVTLSGLGNKNDKPNKTNSNEKDIIIRSPDVLHRVGLGTTNQERA